jgi:hypothetical protein
MRTGWTLRAVLLMCVNLGNALRRVRPLEEELLLLCSFDGSVDGGIEVLISCRHNFFAVTLK